MKVTLIDGYTELEMDIAGEIGVENWQKNPEELGAENRVKRITNYIAKL